MRAILLAAAILLGPAEPASPSELTRLAPVFVSEPPAQVRYAAAGGTRLRCAARGEPPPAITWLGDDGVPLVDRPEVRRVYGNGTLEVLPSSSYHAAASTLRCRAVNAHGLALSRDVTLQPVSEAGWEAVLSAPAAAAGGVAALTCGSTGAPDLVAPAVWYRGDRVIDTHHPTSDSRYLVAGNTLLIRDVSAADAGPYSCLARHALTAHTKRARPAHLAVTTGPSNSAPRLVATSSEVSVAAGADFCLPCVTTEHPPPHYTWYHESGGRLQPVEPSASIWSWAGGAALCFTRAAPRASGAWLCKAYNVYGDATAQMRVDVKDALSVAVAPAVVVADSGSTVRFNCTATDPAASLSWVHDGATAGAGGELVIRGVARAHRGLYQCFARRGRDNAHADAELRLGDSVPELHYTFIEQALRPGGAVSLRCAASGAPPPHFAWMLDAQPLDQYRAQHRYFISEETSVNGDVVSVLNITAASAADGGRYSCRALNELGHAEHSARLNIYGPPSIRALGPVRVVAGANATVFCPYAGYPISSITWWARGAGRAVGPAGRVSARGAELRLWPAAGPDAGHYSCSVTAPGGAAAKRDIEIQVRNPPKISPFIFSSELTEGSAVQVLCGVSSGDKPMYFSWLKDGAPLPSNLQIEEKSLNEFSLLMFSDLTARHSGDYTCRVSNHAATVNYTATLSVKVAPVWVTEPLDTAVLLGAPLHLECAAKGYPKPSVAWYRRIGESIPLSPEGTEQWQMVESLDWGEGSETSTAVRARNGTLSANVAARDHQGLYRCLADNGVGPPLVKHINLTVHEPAHFEGTGGNVSCVRGQSASLTCHALGDAPLTVHWTHLGTRLDLNSYRWTVSEVRTADGLRSVLQLRAAERIDAGEYRCHAHNQYGRSEVLMYLHVEEPPEAPNSLRLGGVGTRWVRLIWRTLPGLGVYYSALCTALHSIPGIDAKHTTANLTLDNQGDDRIEADGYKTLSARLESLRPAAAYSLRLTAANHVGQSPHSDPLLFTTLEEAPSASPQNVRVRPANIGELHVSWSAPPQDSWNGELLGYVASWRELSRFEEEAAGEDGERSGSATSPGWSSAEMTLGGLRSFARYAVAVRAYNRAGAGPPSPLVYATTADGVPESPPTSVFCEAGGARSLRVRWAPPPGAQHAHSVRGYELHYAPLHLAPSWSGTGGGMVARAGAGGAVGEATLQGLRAATNYSVSVRARADRGLGPPSPPVYCSTREDVPGVAEAIRALAVSADTVRVSWLPPAQRAGRLTHYTLYTRELGKVGGEWSQRVEAAEADKVGVEGGAGEVWREVVGLRERTVYEFWVRASTAAGAGPPTRPVTAAPTQHLSVRISSFGRVVFASRGARVRLRCAAVGPAPLRWRWTPLPAPPAHTVTDAGDLIIHKAESNANFTCSVRGGGGGDATSFALVVRTPPAAPAPRLVSADAHALHIAWDAPVETSTPLLGYTVWWSRGGDETGAPRSARVAGETALWLRGLACGAIYRVTVRAHNAVGASPHSKPLLARTRGDKAKAPPGKEFVWANSTALRLNLLAWGGRCPVTAWSVALRPSAPAPAVWTELMADGESALASNLRPGTWYEIRVVARSPAGDTPALYRAATHTINGERIGEPMELPVEARSQLADGAAEVVPDWRSSLAPLLLGGGLAALLASLAVGLVLARRRVCVRRACSLHEARAPHPQLYTTEPGKRNGKTLTPPDGELHEISPYATFSMAGGACEERGGCALHLRTFGRAEALDLAAPPPRPNLLAHANDELHDISPYATFSMAGGACAEALNQAATPPRRNLPAHANDYGGARDSDSESSGSPCAACAAELYRLPAAHLSDTLPAVESSADDTSYSAGAGAGSRASAVRAAAAQRGDRSDRGARQPRGRRRRDHARHASGPTVRYFAAGAPRQEAL